MSGTLTYACLATSGCPARAHWTWFATKTA